MTNEFRGLKKNNKGQLAIESVLLMVVLVGAFLALTKYVKDQKLLAKLVKKPINSVAAMTAYGTWKDTGCSAPGKSAVTLGKCHPNQFRVRLVRTTSRYEKH